MKHIREETGEFEKKVYKENRETRNTKEIETNNHVNTTVQVIQ